MMTNEEWEALKFNQKIHVYFNKEDIENMGLNPKQYGYKGGE